MEVLRRRELPSSSHDILVMRDHPSGVTDVDSRVTSEVDVQLAETKPMVVVEMGADKHTTPSV